MVEEHKGSRETYDHIADWHNCSMPVSKHDTWGRFGLLGILGDMVLYSLRSSRTFL